MNKIPRRSLIDIKSPSIKDALKEQQTKFVKSNYSEKLKNPKWQKKRLEILNIHNFKCELCGCETKELHVHHRFYIKGREVWQYDNDVFQVLCCDCHKKEHSKQQKQVEVIPERYKTLIDLVERLNSREPLNSSYLELFLEEIYNDELKSDLTDTLMNLTDVYTNSYFGDVIKYQIFNYCLREHQEVSMWMTINELKEQIKKLSNG